MTAYRDLVVSAADQNSRPFVFSHGLGRQRPSPLAERSPQNHQKVIAALEELAGEK